MHIDRFFIDGAYRHEDGSEYEDAEDLLIKRFTGFCGCGNPEEALQFMAKVLRMLHTITGEGYEARLQAEKDIFAITGASTFTYYVLSELGLTEHGGSLPGWLTQKGIEFMEDVEELYSEESEE